MLLLMLPDRRELLERKGRMLVLALLNTAVPFTLFSYATLSVSAGAASMLNATTPMFGSLVAYLWLGERLSPLRIFGVLLGFSGVGVIVWGAVGAGGSGGTPWGFLGGMLGAALYGVAASFARRRLAGVSPRVISRLRHLVGDRDGAGRGAGVAGAHARSRALGLRHRARHRLHGLGLRTVFRPARARRCESRRHRDLPDPGVRHPLGRAAARRAGDGVAARRQRHRADRHGARDGPARGDLAAALNNPRTWTALRPPDGRGGRHRRFRPSRLGPAPVERGTISPMADSSQQVALASIAVAVVCAGWAIYDQAS
ncbi:MAG: DMT family transporter [Steroidobacteraceae bacterium]